MSTGVGIVQFFLRLYRALVRSKLDYGCFIYGAPCEPYISLLDPIPDQGLRISLGALRTSPAHGLCVEANELPLSLRKESLLFNLLLKWLPAQITLFMIPLVCEPFW